MRIEVTQEDINNGRRKSCNACPVALAVKRATQAREVSIHEQVGYFAASSFVTHMDVFDLPSEAIEFIDNFDYGNSVRPFAFEVEDLDE